MKLKKNLLFALGVLVSGLSVIGVIYFGFVFMFVGGLIQVIDALKQTDIPASTVAWGVLRVILTGASTVLMAFIAILLNIFLWTCINDWSQVRTFPINRKIG